MKYLLAALCSVAIYSVADLPDSAARGGEAPARRGVVSKKEWTEADIREFEAVARLHLLPMVMASNDANFLILIDADLACTIAKTADGHADAAAKAFAKLADRIEAEGKDTQRIEAGQDVIADAMQGVPDLVRKACAPDAAERTFGGTPEEKAEFTAFVEVIRQYIAEQGAVADAMANDEATACAHLTQAVALLDRLYAELDLMKARHPSDAKRGAWLDALARGLDVFKTKAISAPSGCQLS